MFPFSDVLSSLLYTHLLAINSIEQVCCFYIYPSVMIPEKGKGWRYLERQGLTYLDPMILSQRRQSIFCVVNLLFGFPESGKLIWDRGRGLALIRILSRVQLLLYRHS